MSDSLLESIGATEIVDNKDEIRRKKQEIAEERIETQHDDMVRRKLETKINENISLSAMADKKVSEIAGEGSEYLRLAKSAKPFINDDFVGFIPYFARNVILATAKSGNGKSTICANLAYHALMQGQRVLIISNEEASSDVYNRITCLINNWADTNHSKFTDEQIKTFAEMIPKLSKRITVVDDNFQGVPGQTTTVEGVEAIFESVIRDETQYDVILFDYYQNVSSSSKFPAWTDWKCQERFAKYLDGFKKRYNAPVIVLAQLSDNEDDSYKQRIEGRKIIYNTATCAIEIVAEREHLRTAWTIRKSRFADGVGETIHTGFQRGKYVLYTPDFANNVESRRADIEQGKLMKGYFGKAGIKGDKNANK